MKKLQFLRMNSSWIQQEIRKQGQKLSIKTKVKSFMSSSIFMLKTIKKRYYTYHSLFHFLIIIVFDLSFQIYFFYLSLFIFLFCIYAFDLSLQIYLFRSIFLDLSFKIYLFRSISFYLSFLSIFFEPSVLILYLSISFHSLLVLVHLHLSNSTYLSNYLNFQQI